MSIGSPPSDLKNKTLTRRSRSHASAHAQEDGRQEVITHPMVPRGAPAFISSSVGLSELIGRVRAAGTFAYDSEFIGELTYIPKLCLIQLATTREVALVDPLANGIDLSPFWELVCDPSVEKVVHAGQQDIEPVVRHVGRAPSNVFDTQIAAGFAGMAYPTSLSRLVGEITGARLGKGLTLTHWDQRPLSAMQLRYAADDVRYLPAIGAALGAKLSGLGHVEWAREECDALCEDSQHRFNPDAYYLKIRGATSLTPQGLAVLRELTIWRDGAARDHNVPPRSLVRDEVLVDLARSPVKSVEKLVRVRGLPRPVEQAHGAQIVESTQRALALPASALLKHKQVEQSPSERFAADALWAVTQCLCIGYSIDPNLVTNRQEVGELHRHLLAGENAPDIRLMSGWRKEAILQPLRNLVGGQANIGLAWEEGSGLRLA